MHYVGNAFGLKVERYSSASVINSKKAAVLSALQTCFFERTLEETERVTWKVFADIIALLEKCDWSNQRDREETHERIMEIIRDEEEEVTVKKYY